MNFLKPLEEIPEHLLPFITKQDPSLYTPIDHASWRYILHVSKDFFKETAHEKYLKGLKETGISTEQIPLIQEMDQCLRKFGWRAVGVVGFIPPAAFMEFQSLGILPIACDMRPMEHLAYTPAPDIVHEAAGHAPILADPDYSNYLRHYGEVARKAIFSKHDIEIYEAIRNLSDIKENPNASEEEIQSAQKKLNNVMSDSNYISEANYLARMNWWTVEYGLIGPLDHPKIYGAGLLSSVGESYYCLSDEVKKIPFSLDCLNVQYDITKPQPQLFITSDFETLTHAIEEFSETMAYKKGGIYGLAKAKMSQTTTTAVLDTGLQVSGTLKNFLPGEKGQCIYLQYEGPVQLSFDDKQLQGHGADYHKLGYGTPIGLIKNLGRGVSDLEDSDFENLGFKNGNKGHLCFTSGICIDGVLSNTLKINKKPILLKFTDCKVSYKDQILFEPSWGDFDMACGTDVISVFGGAADRPHYLKDTGGYKQKPAAQKTNLNPKNKELNSLYAQVRKIRESKHLQENELELILSKLEKHPNDWLLRLELLELDKNLYPKIMSQLEKIKQNNSKTKKLIDRGVKAFL